MTSSVSEHRSVCKLDLSLLYSISFLHSSILSLLHSTVSLAAPLAPLSCTCLYLYASLCILLVSMLRIVPEHPCYLSSAMCIIAALVVPSDSYVSLPSGRQSSVRLFAPLVSSFILYPLHATLKGNYINQWFS